MLELQPVSKLLFFGAVSLFWTSIVVMQSIWNIVRRGRIQFFRVKKRDTRPDLLDDPSLGSHNFVTLKVSKSTCQRLNRYRRV